MTPVTLPPGFRFHPTDEEIVSYYLERKITGRTLELEIIPDVDLYKFEPWDLPDKSFLPSKDLEWYFYSPRDRKYPNGSRTNRATKGGYWKATGKDRLVHSNRRPVGMKKTLVYYRGRAPHGIRTNWVMHEYRLLESASGTASSSSLKDSYALCRIFKKTQISKAKGDQTEDTKKETTWVTDEELGENSNVIEISREKEIPEKFSHDVSYKFHCDASSSDVTQGTPAETAIADDLQVQFASDEANSSAANQYSISMDFTSELFQDLQLPFYASLPYHVPHLQIEDFSQMNVADTKFL